MHLCRSQVDPSLLVDARSPPPSRAAFICDWDLAGSLGETWTASMEREIQAPPMGAWQYASAALLRGERHTATFEDDLESFIYVLIILSFIHLGVKGSKDSKTSRNSKAQLLEAVADNGSGKPPTGGHAKRALFTNTDYMPNLGAEEGSPAANLISDLRLLFAQHYARARGFDEIGATSAPRPVTALDVLKLLDDAQRASAQVTGPAASEMIID